jgi:hypothetical protein
MKKSKTLRNWERIKARTPFEAPWKRRIRAASPLWVPLVIRSLSRVNGSKAQRRSSRSSPRVPCLSSSFTATDALPTTLSVTFITLDATGKGSGQIMAAAKIRFDKKKGQYEIESFGNQYIKVTNVRPQ